MTFSSRRLSRSLPVSRTICLLAGAALLFGPSFRALAQQQKAPIQLHVDLTDAPRRLLHVQEKIPVSAGPMTLEYPEWIPGDHRPTGPIDNVAGVFIRADGKDLPWRRDDVDMYALHVDVPSGVSTLDVDFDFLAVPGHTGSDEDDATSQNMAVVEWNSVVMYPAGVPVREIPVTPSITLPAGWGFGTALSFAGKNIGTGASHSAGGASADNVAFDTISVEQLVDSPLIAGRYFREFPLDPSVTPKHYLDVAADAPDDLKLKPEMLTAVSQLVREAGALYKSRHYTTYHFLLSLSDQIRGEGLEHHESSDNGVEEHGFSDPQLAELNGDLLCHEFTHSWNGKYRRPAGLATPDYKTPQKGNLLWVYEGMTQYWGTVLAARSGFWTPDQYRDQLAYTAYAMDNRPGRTWRNVEDTAVASQILRGGTPWWSTWRLSQDYYPEGELIWLDADTTIRKLTHNKKSLNNFVANFVDVGGNLAPNTPPKVLPYSFDDIVNGLNAVVPYDWRGFLRSRLDSHSAHAPLNGITHGGYKLIYTDQPSSYEAAILKARGGVDAVASLGLRVGKDGVIAEVLMNSLAYQAGLGPAYRIVAVNGMAYNDARMKATIHDSKDSKEPIELIVSNSDIFKVVHLNYRGGERYPHLERVSGQPDMLGDILKPMTSAPTESEKKNVAAETAAH